MNRRNFLAGAFKAAAGVAGALALGAAARPMLAAAAPAPRALSATRRRALLRSTPWTKATPPHPLRYAARGARPGIGTLLEQQADDGTWHPVRFTPYDLEAPRKLPYAFYAPPDLNFNTIVVPSGGASSIAQIPFAGPRPEFRAWHDDDTLDLDLYASTWENLTVDAHLHATAGSDAVLCPTCADRRAWLSKFEDEYNRLTAKKPDAVLHLFGDSGATTTITDSAGNTWRPSDQSGMPGAEHWTTVTGVERLPDATQRRPYTIAPIGPPERVAPGVYKAEYDLSAAVEGQVTASHRVGDVRVIDELRIDSISLTDKPLPGMEFTKIEWVPTPIAPGTTRKLLEERGLLSKERVTLTGVLPPPDARGFVVLPYGTVLEQAEDGSYTLVLPSATTNVAATLAELVDHLLPGWTYQLGPKS